MRTPKMSFTAAGDMLIQRMIPADYDGWDQVRAYVKRGDARFFNLETTIRRGDHFGNYFNGGSYLRADPRVLEAARDYGFNMLSFANNHTFDFGYGGLEDTLRAVSDAGFVHAGVGMNLDEAASPAYLETGAGRVALIAMASTMASPNNYAAMAGRQSRRVIGRPGVNGLRVEEKIEVTPAQFEMVRELIEASGVNAYNNILRNEGYITGSPAQGEIPLGEKIEFFCGDRTQYHTYINREDLTRLERSVQEAKAQADYILVSIHAHELSGDSKETPAEFLVDFAHRCIDMGAHAVLGHGPHLLRPLEIYRGCPIFYSLGDFVLHNESMTSAPEDMYAMQGLTSDAPLCEVFRRRSNNYTRGLLCDSRMMESVIPYFEMENGRLIRMELLPIALGVEQPRYRSGNPFFAPDRGILQRLADMSACYGTKITVNRQGIGIVTWEGV